MKKWNLIDQSLTPEGNTISLHEHDGTYTIRIGSAELMSTRRHASEEALAELACRRLKTKSQPHVLIGGLGMGFTLKAALAALPPGAVITIAEILPAVIAWNQNPAFPLASAALADPRVSIVLQDVADVICNSPATFDSIILDVDNGPAALTYSGNSPLYDLLGLRATRAALKPGGCAAFWSAAPDSRFLDLLSGTGFSVEVHRTRSHPRSGPWHTLFIANT